MSQGDYVKNFGPNAYTKPAAGLYMLRQTIMGPELFDYAFRTYAKRWMFKHPSPADFFRTMEDASAMDLDWFWRGWFYTTDYNDIALKEVKKFYLTDQPTDEAKKMAKTKKLLILKVDTGIDIRTIVSGIAESFSPEEVVGKKVTVLVNLAPRALRGVDSEGMILMTETPDGKLVFLNPDDEKVSNGVSIS